MSDPKVYGSIPWTDEERFRDLLARFWIYQPDQIDWDSFPEREALGEFLPILGSIAALQLYGAPEDLKHRSEAVNEALAYAPIHPTKSGRLAGNAERKAVGSFSSNLILMSLRGGRLENDASLRRKISRVLQWWIPPEDCCPEKDGPIDSDLKNEITERKQ